MKRIIALCLVTIYIFLFIGCNSNTGHNSNTSNLLSGSYYAVGDYEEMLIPYLRINAENNEFRFCAGDIVSYTEYGTYDVENRIIIATSQITTCKFEIKDTKTFVLTDSGDNDYFKIPINTQFIFSNNR